MSEEEPKKSEVEIDLQEPLLSSKEEEPPLAAPVAEEVIRTTDAEVVETPHVPTEKWRDGFCGCFSFGCFHPSFLCAWCCPLVGIGQVMSRVNLLLPGGHATEEGAKQQFYCLVGLTALIVILELVGYWGQVPILLTFASLLGLVEVAIIFASRRAVRRRDKIPDEGCGALEDCCASCCCPCCVTSQLMRHTADYEEVTPAWFTHTGLPVADSV